MKLSQPPLQHPPSPPCAGFFLSFRCITLSFPLSIPLLSFPPFAPDGLGRSGHPFPKTWAVLASLRRFHSQEADLGTIVYRSTQAQATHDELASVGAFATVVAHRAIGNRLWFLAKAKTGERTGRKWIRLTLIDCRNGEVAIKSMNETCGPCYYDCPLVFPAQADAPVGPYSASWREQVCAFHANRCVNRVSTRRGVRILYGDHTYVLRYSLGRRGGDVALESDCLVFRLKSRQATWQRDGVAAQATMEGRFQRHVTVPSCTRDPFAQDMLKWSPTVPPPPRPVWTCSGPPPSV